MFERPARQIKSITEAEAKSLSILIVDDDLLLRNRLVSILKSVAVEAFDEARDGKEAIRKYTQRRHNIVFLDIDMPGKDGLSTLSDLKNVDPSVFVVMVSAHSSVDNVRQSLQLGASGFVVKPYTLGKIVEMLRNHVYQRSSAR